jgi:hypothetical protein
MVKFVIFVCFLAAAAVVIGAIIREKHDVVFLENI